MGRSDFGVIAALPQCRPRTTRRITVWCACCKPLELSPHMICYLAGHGCRLPLLVAASIQSSVSETRRRETGATARRTIYQDRRGPCSLICMSLAGDKHEIFTRWQSRCKGPRFKCEAINSLVKARRDPARPFSENHGSLQRLYGGYSYESSRSDLARPLLTLNGGMVGISLYPESLRIPAWRRRQFIGDTPVSMGRRRKPPFSLAQDDRLRRGGKHRTQEHDQRCVNALIAD